MTDIDISLQADMGGIASNAFGEHYLFGINRNLFQGTDASTVFRSYFDESIFEEDRFYVIVGTDSSLLYQYVKTHGVPKGSRYLFLELPQVLALLGKMNDQEELVVATGKDWLKRAEEMEIKKYALMGRLTLLNSLGVVHGHCSDYPPFWREIKGEFDSYIENINVLIRIRPFIDCQIVNLTENQVPATCLKETFRGKTAVVLAGGPSLDELLPWVRQHRRDLLVIAVSRISRSLLQADIQPDISVSVDPQAHNLNVCKDMLEFQDGTLLVNNYHLSPNLLVSWGGQKVFVGARYPWPTPLQPENISPCGGTTVTNTALDLAVKAGVAQVILGGVDFCFAQQGHTHASGTVEHKMGSMPQRCELQVETNGGMMADTANGYLESGKTIDMQAREAVAQGCRVINPASGAMRLTNVEHLSLDAIQIEALEQPAREILASNVPFVDGKTRIQLYKEELGEVDRVLAELRAIKTLSNKALNYNDKVLTKGEQGGDAHNKSKQLNPIEAKKVDRIDQQINAKYTDTIEFIKRYGVTRFIPILRLDVEHLEDLVQNSQIHFQAFVDTSNELIEILHQARARIVSRLEEEKPTPNVQRLIDQWQHDQHPGRAIQWAQQHVSYVSQLPDAQQQALRAFQNTFDDTVEELGRDYVRFIKQDAGLDRTAGRAKEYFLCHDKDGMIRLLAGLQTHHDQNLAAHFIPLVQGYIAEFQDKPVVAIDAYQSIVEGPAYIDALMRLFNLHSKAQDWEPALEVLKTLSGINTLYSPMYADLLYASGDVDTAVETYTEYVLANPDDLDTMMRLGQLFQQCGSVEGVTWIMGYILGKDPENHTAQQILNEMGLNMDTETTHS